MKSFRNNCNIQTKKKNGFPYCSIQARYSFFLLLLIAGPASSKSLIKYPSSRTRWHPVSAKDDHGVDGNTLKATSIRKYSATFKGTAIPLAEKSRKTRVGKYHE